MLATTASTGTNKMLVSEEYLSHLSDYAVLQQQANERQQQRLKKKQRPNKKGFNGKNDYGNEGDEDYDEDENNNDEGDEDDDENDANDRTRGDDTDDLSDDNDTQQSLSHRPSMSRSFSSLKIQQTTTNSSSTNAVVVRDEVLPMLFGVNDTEKLFLADPNRYFRDSEEKDVLFTRTFYHHVNNLEQFLVKYVS
jgi:hypothetical protein